MASDSEDIIQEEEVVEEEIVVVVPLSVIIVYIVHTKHARNISMITHCKNYLCGAVVNITRAGIVMFTTLCCEHHYLLCDVHYCAPQISLLSFYGACVP